jgi:HSP20 family protein
MTGQPSDDLAHQPNPAEYDHDGDLDAADLDADGDAASDAVHDLAASPSDAGKMALALASLPAMAELDGIRARIARLAGGVWQPAADWFESDEDLILVIDAPGIDARSIEMSHDGQEITIAAEREASHYGQSRSTERPQGGFQRTMRIPEPVEPGSAAAQYRLGQIEVHFRKLSRTITVVVEAVDG